LGRTARRRLERLPRRLVPLLLLLLELPRLLLTVMLLQLPTCLLLPLLLFFLLLLVDGGKPGRPGRSPRNKRGLGLFVHRTGIPRSPVAARPVTYSNGIPLDPRSRRLGVSLLPLKLRCLGSFWRRRGRLTRQGMG